MLGVGRTLPDFKITGVKPGFMRHEENGASAFETLTQESFPGQSAGTHSLEIKCAATITQKTSTPGFPSTRANPVMNAE